MKKIIFYILFLFNVSAVYSQTAEESYMKGVSKLLKVEYDSAVHFLNLAISENNQSELYYIKRGDIYLSMGKSEEAIADFKYANNLNNHVADLFLAKAYSLSNNPEEAVNYLQQHLSSPYKKSEKNIKADPYFDKIQDSDDWYNLWENVWYTDEEKLREEIDYLLKNENFIDALTLIDSKIKESKNKETLYQYRADVFSKQGNPKAAVLDLNLTIEKNKTPELFEERAENHYKSGNYLQAISDYSSALRYDPAQFQLYLDRAEAFRKANNPSAALKDFETYLTYFPDDEGTLYRCGDLYLQSNSYISALKCYNKVITLNRKNPEYYKARGKTYYQSKMYKLAVDDLSTALDLYPNDGETYYYKGLVRSKAGDKSGACDDWKKAVELGEKKAIELLIDNCQ